MKLSKNYLPVILLCGLMGCAAQEAPVGASSAEAGPKGMTGTLYSSALKRGAELGLSEADIDAERAKGRELRGGADTAEGKEFHETCVGFYRAIANPSHLRSISAGGARAMAACSGFLET